MKRIFEGIEKELHSLQTALYRLGEIMCHHEDKDSVNDSVKQLRIMLDELSDWMIKWRSR